MRVILPYLYPAWLTGFALAFARAIGEYGSVVFISGNMPMRTEITPLLIVTKLEQYDYAGATAVALVLLLISFVLLFAINALQGWSARRLAELMSDLRKQQADRAARPALGDHRDRAAVSDAVSDRPAGVGVRGGVRQGHGSVLQRRSASRTRCRRFG